MIEPDGDKIRAIAWTEVFPWLKIAKVFRLAIAFRALLFGALGVLLTATGWILIAAVFETDADSTGWLKQHAECPWTRITDSIVPDRPALGLLGEPAAPRDESTIARSYDLREVNPISTPWTALSRPAVEGISFTSQPPRAIASVILCGLWAAAVWAFFGAAICRAAAVQLAAEEKVGLNAAVNFASRKWGSFFAAPLLPVVGLALAAAPVVLLGLIMRAGGFGLLLGGIFWPLALIAGFVMALLLLGIFFAWPLMWGAIATEGSDSFDALSRSYAYLFQRPLRYLLYAAVAALFGWLGWLLVREFAAGVVWLTSWAAGWGYGAEPSIRGGDVSGAGRAGAALILFWSGCVKLLAVGYLFSYFWSASTAIYLLLRKDVDNTEMNEVFLENEQEAEDLPAIVKDSAGAPVAEGDADPSQSETPESQNKTD